MSRKEFDEKYFFEHNGQLLPRPCYWNYKYTDEWFKEINELED